jgi:hypothetical protein
VWCKGIAIYILAWAINVARSTISGNARAFGCGTSDEVVPTSSFYAVNEKRMTVESGSNRQSKKNKALVFIKRYISIAYSLNSRKVAAVIQ